MHPVLASLRTVLEKQPRTRQALVFGSVASGRARMDSDLDIPVAAGRPFGPDDRLAWIEALALRA